jgi:4-oxalocrotonate tautomerase
MPILEVHLLSGRPDEVKSELVRELTDVVHRTLGSAPERIQVLISEYPDGAWHVGGEPLLLGESAARD